MGPGTAPRRPVGTVPGMRANANPNPAVAEVVYPAAAVHLEATVPARPGKHARERAARSRWLGPELAARLARSAVDTVRASVAANPRTPLPVLERLGRDNKLLVRDAAHANPRFPFDRLPEREVGRLVEHPDCPGDIVMAALAERP